MVAAPPALVLVRRAHMPLMMARVQALLQGRVPAPMALGMLMMQRAALALVLGGARSMLRLSQRLLLCTCLLAGSTRAWQRRAAQPQPRPPRLLWLLMVRICRCLCGWWWSLKLRLRLMAVAAALLPAASTSR